MFTGFDRLDSSKYETSVICQQNETLNKKKEWILQAAQQQIKLFTMQQMLNFQTDNDVLHVTCMTRVQINKLHTRDREVFIRANRLFFFFYRNEIAVKVQKESLEIITNICLSAEALC